MTKHDTRFSLTGGLGKDHLQLILSDVHRLLGEVGLEIDHPALRKELSEHPGITVRGDRVCYAPELVEKARAEVPQLDTNYACSRPGETAFSMVTPFSPFETLDFETGEKRPANDDDVRLGARLYDAFDAIGPVHVHLARMDQKIAQVHIARLCCENSRTVGNWAPAYTYEQAVCIRDMYLAARRPEPYVAFQMTHSPLRLDAFFLDILMRMRETPDGVRGLTAGGGAMPLAGVSAPIYWRSAAAVGLAEALGGWITARLIDPRIRPYASILAMAPDMSTCKWTMSTPEGVAWLWYNHQVMRELLGLCDYVDCGDVHLMCLHALQGTRRFACGGQRQECFSPAHVPVDAEKIAFVEATVRGMPMPEDPDVTLRIVRETLPRTSFLEHETTMEFREIFRQPRFFTGTTPAELGQRLMDDSADLLPQSREIARRKIAGNPFRLADDVAYEVARVYDRGVRSILAAPERPA